MSKLSNFIKEKNNSAEKVLSVFLTAGYPSKNNFVELATGIYESGADIIELGFPFSDPLADGPIIQHSSQLAIENGVTLKDVFNYAEEIKKINNKPLILMGYANPILSYGIKNFARDIKNCGVDGIIIPDIPIEEYDSFFGEEFIGIDVILLITPTTAEKRIQIIDNKSEGFVYCVSVSGTTGIQNTINATNNSFLESARKNITRNKMLIGFGISKPQDVKRVSPYCDGVIVGSAVIRTLQNKNNFTSAYELIKNMKKELMNNI